MNGRRNERINSSDFVQWGVQSMWTFHALYKRKNCILTSRFHNRGRVWRATERFIDGFLLFPHFVPLYATFALEYYARGVARSSLVTLSWKFLFVWRSFSSSLFEKQEIKHKRELRISKRSFTVIRLRKHVKSHLFFLYLLGTERNTTRKNFNCWIR